MLTTWPLGDAQARVVKQEERPEQDCRSRGIFSVPVGHISTLSTQAFDYVIEVTLKAPGLSPLRRSKWSSWDL